MIGIVESTHLETRIYVFLGDNHALIDFTRLLKQVVRDKISEYVIITVDERMYSSDAETYMLKTPFEDSSDLHQSRIQSFETVLLLVRRQPLSDKWEEFLADVRDRNTKEPISSGLLPHYKNNLIKVPIYAAYLYDAVRTYAISLDKVLAAGGSPYNGTAIIENIRNRTFTSILGYEVYVDRQGDAEGNYTLITFDTDTENGNVSVVPTGDFRMAENGVGIPSLNLFHSVKWKIGHPPLDEPVCGFHNERCKREFEWRTLAVCLVVAVMCVVALVFFVRHYRYEQKLARLLWKVDFKDIIFVDTVEEIVPPSRKKRKRQKGHPFRFILSYDNEPERTTLLSDPKCERSTGSDTNKRSILGSYKGTPVSVKHIVRKNVEIDRDLKKQLQLRKELNHDNIARFVGACVDTPNVYIMTQFCQRGSLHDILQNEDFSLDDIFVSSLVSDLIKGMTFIHDSEIFTHGNLKSSNCLVDSRWVLMVSDFGLHKLDNERSGSISDMKIYYEKLIWKAPELLRSAARDPTGSQKGDVYAFAFILYEMIGRKGPWGDLQYTSREIYDMIKQGYEIRPTLSLLTCEPFIKTCIKDCWHENPDQRPDFKNIRLRLKQMLQGVKSNIFDNMLDMMEKYANNLESVVAERTEQLSEEKKMTENLLLRMLPRFVADKLKIGEPVIPEVYDSVTVFFSDIVGFTALSAESTPMQVVCMLNDLYTIFDAIVENYDVYKIETIGDAYFVVSGLPLRNDELHAGEIASMSLHMLREIINFKISHRPNDTLKLRIGIHSGAVVAGVVGLKMPRYTVFGDTVNTASRMESTGVPLKIHCSSKVTTLLQKLGGYTLVERGYVTAKGKGEMLTYFLESEDETHRQRRISLNRQSKSGATSVPTLDVFGAPIINPKYWTTSGPTSPQTECSAISFQNNNSSFSGESMTSLPAICDKDKLFDDVFSEYCKNKPEVKDSETRLNSTGSCNSLSELVIHPNPDLNPFTDNKSYSHATQAQTLNLPLTTCNGSMGYVTDDVIKDGAQSKLLRNLEILRQNSRSSNSFEEDTL
ncbi:hypothetical protein ACF0H5_024556 [Mactra antiquata]